MLWQCELLMSILVIECATVQCVCSVSSVWCNMYIPCARLETEESYKKDNIEVHGISCTCCCLPVL
jgi:hypothetical protein